MPDAVDQICADLDIKIVECRETCGPFRTKAAATLAQLLRDHGAGHLIIVLRTITESAGNERMLIAPVIWAVSDLILAHPHWTATGLQWIEAFDHIGLDRIVAAAKANRSACPVRYGVAALLHERFSPCLPGPAKRVRLAMPARLAEAA